MKVENGQFGKKRETNRRKRRQEKETERQSNRQTEKEGEWEEGGRIAKVIQNI